jgi:hypothetical protein
MTVWERRDFPVLQALAKSGDENVRNGFLHVSRRGTAPLAIELSPDEIHESILALGDADYVDFSLQYSGGGATFTQLHVTGRGQQALGEWPLFDEIASPDTLALLLERLAEEAPSDEEADNLRRAAQYARSLGAASLRALAVSALSQLARVGLGLG